MRTLTYLVGTTVDGHIAGPADETDFSPLGADLPGHLGTALPGTLPTHVRAQLGIDAPDVRFDTVVMGRHTYRPGLDIGMTSPYAHLRQFVVSPEGGLPEDPAVTLVREDPLAAGGGWSRRTATAASGWPAAAPSPRHCCPGSTS